MRCLPVGFEGKVSKKDSSWQILHQILHLIFARYECGRTHRTNCLHLVTFCSKSIVNSSLKLPKGPRFLLICSEMSQLNHLQLCYYVCKWFSEVKYAKQQQLLNLTSNSSFSFATTILQDNNTFLSVFANVERNGASHFILRCLQVIIDVKVSRTDMQCRNLISN